MGSFAESYAAPPTVACSSSRPSSLRARRTFTASATTSGPSPSPGRTAINMDLAERPGLFDSEPILESPDLVCVAQGEPDIVEAVREAELAEGVDLEAHRLG